MRRGRPKGPEGPPAEVEDEGSPKRHYGRGGSPDSLP